jgi:sugar/nucleoside kinase (ribokinase family)
MLQALRRVARPRPFIDPEDKVPDTRLDVLAIGNAIVDVIADADDAFLAREGMHKGAMRLIDEEEAKRLYDAMGPARELSGGSAANTVAGIASLGLKAGFVGQLADDQLGAIFRHDIRSLGVEFETKARSDVGATARCLILVTPDAQRTMNTFLGAAQMLGPDAVDPAHVASAKILYLEGYLWDPAEPRAAMYKAMDAAREAGTKVAFTLSDSFVVDRHRSDLLRLLDEKRIDILFANQVEVEALAQVPDVESAVTALRDKVGTLVVTRHEHGALATRGRERAEVPAEPIRQLVDTTGAGDLFAAGFLTGEARGLGLDQSLRLGAIAAAEVIQHYGARPETDLKRLAGELIAA